MSADFYFGMVVGMVGLLVSLVSLLIWSKRGEASFGERSLVLMRERNRLDESKTLVLQGMSGWIAQLVELLRDAGDARCDDFSPPSAGLAVGAAVGFEDVPSGGSADGGDVPEGLLNEAQVRAALAWVAQRCQKGVFTGSRACPGALFDLAMKYEAALEARAGARDGR